MARRYITLRFDDVDTNPASHFFVFGDESAVIPCSLCRDLNLNEKTVQVQEWFVMRERLEVYEAE